MSTRPLYYLHNAAPYTEAWTTASRYRLTANNMLQVLGYYSGDRSLDELALELAGELAPLPLNDSLLWQREHKMEARQAHSVFYPQATRIQPGLLVNGDQPWLACQVDDFTWGVESPGLTLYKAPYSKMLYQAPMAAHELQLCYTAAVCQWSRPMIDYVVWTPSSSSTKRYTPATVLVARDNLTLLALWDNYLWPRLQHFQSTVLQPFLASRNFDPVRIYDCIGPDYVAVRDPNLSFAALTAAFSA
jgi:hypothetical protein